MEAWAQKLTSSPDGMKKAIVGTVCCEDDDDDDTSPVFTKTLSQSQLLASFRDKDIGRRREAAKIVTGFPPSVPRQKTRASIFSREIWLPTDDAPPVVLADRLAVLVAELMALAHMAPRARSLEIPLALAMMHATNACCNGFDSLSDPSRWNL
jgi:hypothetical protein